MASSTYLARRGELQTYFDRTAAKAWERLTQRRAGQRHPRHRARRTGPHAGDVAFLAAR